VGADAATGILSIRQGGKVSNFNAFIGFGGFAPGASVGTVSVEGTGSTWINNGNLFIGGSESAPGGLGTLRIQNGGTVVTNATTVWGPGALEIGADANLIGALGFDGGTLRAIADTSFASDASLATGGMIVDSNGFNSTLNGRLSGPGGLTKVAAGAIVLANANTYGGPTAVNAGTLLVNGSITSNVTVNAGTLGGSGTTGAVLVNSGGVLAPGANGPGILQVNGNLSLLFGSIYLVDLNGSIAGSGYDQMDVNGMVSLSNATLSTLLSFMPSSVTSFTIINNDLMDPVIGIFNSLPEGATFTAGQELFKITYKGGDGNDVVLTSSNASVPDAASTLVLFTLAVVALRCFSRVTHLRTH
jgi:T5SS/PEP-CTERM-associated repeat protein/autotransporter-associated beta strand protein